MNALEDNAYTQIWRELGRRIGRPRAIVAISAHGLTPGTRIGAARRPATIHDFGGFPAALHAFEYPAPGDPVLAETLVDLLAGADARLDPTMGLDHGTWSVLAHVYPAADIPVLQVSMDARRPAAWHFETGRRLAPLRRDGVLIMGTGNVVHNLRTIRWDEPSAPYPWAEAFEAYVRAGVVAGDYSRLSDYAAEGPAARLAVPTPEHFWPLLYCLGALEPDEPAEIVAAGIVAGSISMLSVAAGLAGREH